MIRKAALILFSFSALVGAHLLYTAGFAMLAESLAVGGGDVASFPESDSETAQISRQLALDHFGADHFTAKRVKLSYYDKSRGSFMYAENHEFSDAGKVMTITPFAMISVSRDGKSHKTVTSDKAIIRFNVAFAFLGKKDEPQRVIHAELIGNVKIRDDKGTSTDPMDDLLIGPLTRVQYEERTMQVTSDSEVVIRDQDMTIVGTRLMLQLRRKNAAVLGTGAGAAARGGPGNGTFDAETAFLYENIHVKIENVGAGGVLMGQSKPDDQGRTPLNLWCAGAMRIDLPKAPAPVAVGPPNIYREPEPTLCHFDKDVRVVRGINNYDRLNCDTLHLTFRPDAKPDAAATPVPPAAEAATGATGSAGPNPAASGGAMSQLKLRTALAQGHAVWVQSESQKLRAKCVELKYDKKLAQGQPDSTYLNGGTNRKLWVEKTDHETEGPKAGSVKSVMELVAADMSILDFGDGVNQITARGPGNSIERPSRSESVVREAWFEDSMMLQTSRDAVKPPADAGSAPNVPPGPMRRLVTLSGQSTLKDLLSGSNLDAKEKIVAEFESAPKAAGAPGGGGDGPARIKWLKAYDNVHLTTPGRTLTAWRTFQATFVAPEPKPVAVAGTAPVGAAPGRAAPVVAANEGDPALPEAKPDAPPPAVEGAVDGRANHVYATIVQGRDKDKSDLRDAKLRGGVMVHQDPAPGERFGKNASGEALDLYSQGKGLMRFAVAAADPQAANPEPKTRLAAGAAGRAETLQPRLISRQAATPLLTLSRVELDGKIIESEDMIGVDQQANYAWARGHGSMTQTVDAGLLDDKGVAADRRKSKAGASLGSTDQFRVSWNEEMRFYGRSHDRQNREAAKVELRGSSELVQTPDGHQYFRRGVVAKKTDAAIYCDSMDVYMDRVIDFSRANKMNSVARVAGDPNPAASKAGTEPDAEIAFIECHGADGVDDKDVAYAGVDVQSFKYFAGTKNIEDKYRIFHNHLVYDKRTGDFEGAGPGIALIYKGKLPDPRRAQAVPVKGTKPASPQPPPTLQLTKIQFTDLMQGRFGVSRSGNDNEARQAEFAGNVQTVNGTVADQYHDIDFDHLEKWDDALFLTSDFLRVRSEPQLSGTKSVDHQFLYAQGNANAKTKNRLIQGDRMTYDSATENIYVYGDDGKKVALIEQNGPAQEPNINRGKALRYNKRTGQGQIEEPSTIKFFEAKSGIRPKPNFPDLGGSGPKPDPKKPQRMKMPKPARNSTERKSFTGGQ